MKTYKDFITEISTGMAYVRGDQKLDYETAMGVNKKMSQTPHHKKKPDHDAKRAQVMHYIDMHPYRDTANKTGEHKEK